MSWFKDQKRAVYDMLERAGKSFAQNFLAVATIAITPATMFTGAAWYQSAGVGLGAGLISIVLSLSTWKVPPIGYGGDVAIRVVRTFLGTLGASWGATVGPFDVFHFDWHDALWLAASTAGASFVTSILSTNVSLIDNAGKSASLAYGAVPVTEKQEAKLVAKAAADAENVPVTGVVPANPTLVGTGLPTSALTSSTAVAAAPFQFTGQPVAFNSAPEQVQVVNPVEAIDTQNK